MKHEIKCEQPYFDDIWNGLKNVELRYNDRKYKEFDYVIQKLYDKEKGFIDKIIITRIITVRPLPEDSPDVLKNFYVLFYFEILGKYDFT